MNDASHIFTLANGRKVCVFTLPLDPSLIGTAQQKKVSFRCRRIFTDPKVERTEKNVAILARVHRAAVRSVIGPTDHIRLEAVYRYNYPKGTPKCRMIDGATKGNGADADNIHKAVQDALGPLRNRKTGTCRGACLWEDDRLISTLVVKKRYTLKQPCIDISVSKDEGD